MTIRIWCAIVCILVLFLACAECLANPPLVYNLRASTWDGSVGARHGDTIYISFDPAPSLTDLSVVVNGSLATQPEIDESGHWSSSYVVRSTDNGWLPIAVYAIDANNQFYSYESTRELVVDDATPTFLSVTAFPEVADMRFASTAVRISPSPNSYGGPYSDEKVQLSLGDLGSGIVMCSISADGSDWGPARVADSCLDDEFEDSNSGTRDYYLSYTPGFDHQCGDFINATYVQYDSSQIPSWGTIAFWLKPVPGRSGTIVDAIGDDNWAYNQRFSGPQLKIDNGNLVFRMWNGSAQTWSSPITAPLGSGWHYVAISYGYDGMYLYLDGDLANSETACQTGFDGSHVYIGDYPNDGWCGSFEGKIDCLCASPTEQDPNLTAPPTNFEWTMGWDGNTHSVTARAIDPAGNERDHTIVVGDELRSPNNVVYVNCATDNQVQDGHSWATAVSSIEAAIAVVNDDPSRNEIWVARGTYAPVSGLLRADRMGVPQPHGGFFSDACLVIPPGVRIYGGFIGDGTERRGDRNCRLNETILDGSNLTMLIPLIGSAGSGTTPTVIDGFTITAWTGVSAIASNMIISHNKIVQCQTGIDAEGADCDIFCNTFEDNGQCGFQSLGAGCLIHDNLFRSNTYGLLLDVNDYSIVSNNTIVGNDIGIEAACCTAVNNIIAFQTGAGVESSYGFGLDLRYNSVYGNNPNYYGIADPLTTNGNVPSNPLLDDACHISVNSPCIDKGDTDYAIGYQDAYSNPRVTDGDGDGTAVIDIGACEGHWIRASNVTSPDNDGTYGPGSTITVYLEFVDSISVVGQPKLLLNTGRAEALADYSGVVDGTKLAFTYTVQDGDSTNHLDYVADNPIRYNGGAVLDAFGHDVAVVLPAPGAAGSLGANSSIALSSCNAPSVPTITSPSGYVDDPAPLVTWTGANYDRYQVQVYASDSTLVWDSGILSGTATSAQIQHLLNDGATYSVKVTLFNNCASTWSPLVPFTVEIGESPLAKSVVYCNE